MKKLTTLLLAVFALAVLGGCAMVITNKADLTKSPNGIRVYPSRVYLMVDSGEKGQQ